MPAQHDIAAETELWDTFAASAFKDDAEPSFCWTQYAGHGPGPELLGTRAAPAVSSCSRSHRPSRRTDRRACTREASPERRWFTYRYSYRPAVWERLLTRAGFATADACVLDAPHPGHIGTLLVRAVAS